MTAPRWASIAKAAEYLDSSETSVRKLIAEGLVTGYKPETPTMRRFLRVDLNELDKVMGKPVAAE